MPVRCFKSCSIVLTSVLLAGGLQAAQIDNETVEIADAFMAFPGYDVEWAIDTGEDRFISDYASQGGAADTYIVFDFGAPQTFSEIIMTDRVTSGGGNFAWFGGLFDYNRAFSYIFSLDDDFTNGDGVSDDVVIEADPEEPDFGPVLEDEIELLQTSTPIPNVRAQFIRWQVDDTPGQNPGANDFQFFVGAGGLQAGDSNMDFSFDQIDLVQVQIAAKYLTGQAATWGEGDWDGAPGGEPGSPPTGDGLFDQLDLIAALNAGVYGTGPYNAIGAGG